MWFKVPALPSGTGALLFSSARDDTGDNHSLALFLTGDGELRIDMFWVATVIGDTGGLDDGTWHHVASVFDAATGITTLYLDGAVEQANNDINQTIPNIEEDTVLIGDTLNTEFPAGEGVEPLIGCVDDVGIYDQALTQPEVAAVMSEGFICCCCPHRFLSVDPNTMTVYETGETEGDFSVSLGYPPLKQGPPNEGTSVTVDFLIDPYVGLGPNDDIILIDGIGPENQVTFSRTAANWEVPEVILFKAIDDAIAEPPDLEEVQDILVSTNCAEEPNFNSERTVWATVVDNDQADILLTYTLPERNPVYADVTGPVQLWEEPRIKYGIPYPRWRKIGVTLQVPPAGGPVKLNAEIFSDASNPPLTDPCLPFLELNGLIFTAANYDVRQPIKIWGNDDDVLQAVGATVAGDQNYQADLVFTVIDDGGDERFTGMQRTVQFDIEDNECGAFGISYLDIGNPNAFTDPNIVTSIYTMRSRWWPVG
jgi:hypothetical protein